MWSTKWDIFMSHHTAYTDTESKLHLFLSAD